MTCHLPGSAVYPTGHCRTRSYLPARIFNSSCSMPHWLSLHLSRLCVGLAGQLGEDGPGASRTAAERGVQRHGRVHHERVDHEGGRCACPFPATRPQCLTAHISGLSAAGWFADAGTIPRDGASSCVCSPRGPLYVRCCAGAAHGQELSPERMEALIRSTGRQPWQRTTLYAAAAPAQTVKSFGAAPLSQLVMS